MKQIQYIKDFKLELTCYACPEQYDVFKQGRLIGYLRLRHGNFYAACPDVGGTTVYQACPEGDGMFNQEERLKYLTKAIIAIKKHRQHAQSKRVKYNRGGHEQKTIKPSNSKEYQKTSSSFTECEKI